MYIWWLLFPYSNEIEGTPLSSAASAGQHNIVSYLLNTGACCDGRFGENKFTVATHAQYNVLFAICIYLEHTTTTGCKTWPQQSSKIAARV